MYVPVDVVEDHQPPPISFQGEPSQDSVHFQLRILLALLRWDKDQKPFEGSPASLKAFACPSSGGCTSANSFFFFSFFCLSWALRLRRFVELAAFALLGTKASFFIPSSTISDITHLKRSSGEPTSRIVIHWCSCHWVVRTAISSRFFVPQMLISQSCCSGLSILTAAFSHSIHWSFVSDMGGGMSFMGSP